MNMKMPGSHLDNEFRRFLPSSPTPGSRPGRGASSAACAALIFALCNPALAGPGAHGPGGEHLDAPHAHGTDAASGARMESKSELFEVVARLEGGELSIMIDRFETNEPVLDAAVRVATGALEANARFHADHGDYAVDDTTFLKTLSAPGEHALIFTVVAGKDADLLEGTLTVGPAQAQEAPAEHSHWAERVAIAAAVLASAAVLFFLRRRRSRRRAAFTAAQRRV